MSKRRSVAIESEGRNQSPSTPITSVVIFWITALSSMVTACGVGCARYQFGSQSLYNPNVRTIFVPIVRNDTWRHELGPQLTESLQKAIELRTPYKVVSDPRADSTLTCRVRSETKRVLTETNTDEPRALDALVTVQVNWTDRRGNLLMENRFVPQGELAYYFVQGIDFVPEGGQSVDTAHRRAIERLANQIVSQMEARW